MPSRAIRATGRDRSSCPWQGEVHGSRLRSCQQHSGSDCPVASKLDDSSRKAGAAPSHQGAWSEKVHIHRYPSWLSGLGFPPIARVLIFGTKKKLASRTHNRMPAKRPRLAMGRVKPRKDYSMAKRTSDAEWRGDLRTGAGTLKLGSGAFEGKYSFKSRFEDGPGTNPEELIAAAHAACFSMALSAALAGSGHPPTRIHTTRHRQFWSRTRRIRHLQDRVGDRRERSRHGRRHLRKNGPIRQEGMPRLEGASRRRDQLGCNAALGACRFRAVADIAWRTLHRT
jgi:hypothetical protein